MEEFLIYSSAKSADMDLNLPSRLLHGNGYGTTPMFCVSCREFKFQPRNNSKYLVAELLQLFWLALQGSFRLYFKGIRMFVCPVIAKSQCVCHRCESQNYIVDTCDVTDRVLKLKSSFKQRIVFQTPLLI